MIFNSSEKKGMKIYYEKNTIYNISGHYFLIC